MTTITSCEQTENKIIIHTTEYDITIEIDDYQLCCEKFGTKTTFNETFIGAEVNKVRWAWAKEEAKYGDMYDGSATIIVETTRGNFDLTAWNNHNGYYPHDVRVSWENFQEEVKL